MLIADRRGAVQRARIVQAMVDVVAERGFAGTTVRLVTTRAGVSSRTFYECFDGLEDCFSEVLDLGLARAFELITQAFAQEDDWQNGVRAALASILAFFDSEPRLARVWFVETMAAGSRSLERRERNLARLRAMIVDYWSQTSIIRPEPVAVAGVMASLLGLIHSHLISKEPTPLIELLGPMMGLITAPYLDRAQAAREIQRGANLARTILTSPSSDQTVGPVAHAPRLALGACCEVPASSEPPSAPRVCECVLYLAEHPGSSNREVASGIGVRYQSQISNLLAQLLRENLAVKLSRGAGKRNEWNLTPQGEVIARVLSEEYEPSRQVSFMSSGGGEHPVPPAPRSTNMNADTAGEAVAV
jgi:AcrR family transcriptional regulator